MSENIIDRINESLTLIDDLQVPRKVVKDKLTAVEFNRVIDKINEVKDYLNNKNKSAIIDTTSYLLDKIENARITLIASNVKMAEGSPRSLLDEINDIQYHLNIAENKATDNKTSIEDINSRLSTISESLGFVTNEINTTYESAKSYADEVAYTAYNNAKEYTDEAVDTAYNKAKQYTDDSYTRLYTHINDTTLTFDYDVRTDPEPPSPKNIYDNDEDLYDGEYHD